MLQQLINRSPDLKRLRDEGYDIEIVDGYLLLKDVPYVNASKEVKRGVLVSELTLAGDRTATPSTHVVHFAGEYPCRNDGNEITQIKHGSQRTRLAHDLDVDHSFSNKPPDGYPDYYEKMTRYVTIISNYAQAIDPNVTATTFPVITATEIESVFHYIDTASSRAGINVVSDKLTRDKIAIIGAGGTGSYVLDLVAKTPVQTIDVYDGDTFSQHNAFRTPGAPSIEALRAMSAKAHYLAELYSRMHRHITPHGSITPENIEELRAATFVFLCVDDGPVKQLIIERLEAFGTPFIDVGMGVDLIDGSLGGILRVTTSTATKRDHIRQRVSFSRGADQEYDTNIQIADLNALNAALAVMKWKKLRGFYRDLEHEHHTTFTIDGAVTINEDAE